MSVALIIILWVSIVGLIMTLIKNKGHNCSGDCRQGRAPCNCRKEKE